MMIGWGGKDFRWGGKVWYNRWVGKVRCNSAVKNHPSARPCIKGVLKSLLSHPRFVYRQEKKGLQEDEKLMQIHE